MSEKSKSSSWVIGETKREPDELRLLVVDDDEVDRLRLRRALTPVVGVVEVVEAVDVASAKRALDGGNFDCVFVDHRLPDGTSHDLLEALRVADGTLAAPVIVVTGDSRRISTASLKEGAQDYLSKDELSPTSMARALRHALERHRLLVELRQRDQELLRSQRMDAVGALAGGIAHDFNNMLTAISGFSQMALRLLSEDHPAYSKVDQVIQAAERSARLTRQILAFARKQVLHPEILDLSQLVVDLLPLLHRLLGEQLEVVERLGTEVMVEADPGQLEQVVLNLVLNARDAMPEGGRITVATDQVEVSHPGGDHELVPGLYACLVVSDEGHGMDAETLSRVFEPFFTTKGGERGTGLGLSVVHGVIKQTGGSVHVESEVGQGTTFRVYLPIAKVTARTAIRKATPAPTKAVNRETILLAEDDELVRRLLQTALEEAGFTVMAATNGLHALELCEERNEAIDLVLTDLVMPLLGGRELADRLKAMDLDVPVLYMSGYSGEVESESERIDSAVYVQKPVAPMRLIGRIRTLLDGGC